MKKIIFIIVVLLTATFQLSAQKNKRYKKAKMVLIITDLGNIKVKLYNETPLHKYNFLKLASEGKYNGSIFHRVIPQFMIQGGGSAEGKSDIGEPIPAEIVPGFIHKKGALAAARMPDNVNPEKKSSGSQFYIVHGKTFTASDMELVSQRNGITYTKEQIEAYTTVGGAPHLDGSYTVFGEVVEGMEVIDKIAAVERNPMDKPLKDIKMTMKVVKR